jgi:hypothetical protein
VQLSCPVVTVVSPTQPGQHADKFISSIVQEIEWTQIDTKTDLISIQDDNSDRSDYSIPAGTGTALCNDGWTAMITIPPLSQVVRDISHLPLPAFGRTIYKDFDGIVNIGIHNKSSGSIIVGTSGVADSILCFGYSSQVGPSGCISSCAPLGITVSSGSNNVGIYNPNVFSASIQLSLTGDRL